MSGDIHHRSVSQEMTEPSITEISLKITYLEFYSNISGANELILPLQPYQQLSVTYHVALSVSDAILANTTYYSNQGSFCVCAQPMWDDVTI